MAIPVGLLDSVRNRLDITWEDDLLDEKLQGMISRGIRYINKIAGGELDYSQEDKPRELLFAYVMYDYSDKLEEFARNYLHEILSLQIEKEIEAYGSAE